MLSFSSSETTSIVTRCLPLPFFLPWTLSLLESEFTVAGDAGVAGCCLPISDDISLVPNSRGAAGEEETKEALKGELLVGYVPEPTEPVQLEGFPVDVLDEELQAEAGPAHQPPEDGPTTLSGTGRPPLD